MRYNLIRCFKDEKEFREFVFQQDSFSLNIREWIFYHEKSHFEMAKKLGYNPRFAHDDMNFKFLVLLDESDNPSTLDEIMIALAPEDPGRDDLHKAYFLMNGGI